MRLEISELHQQLGKTMIYVTHDQVEAMTMADKIVVLNAGNIEQVGSPLELYRTPKNLFVAGFIGSPKMNFDRGRRGGQARRPDHRRPPRAHRGLDRRRPTAPGRARSASPSTSAPDTFVHVNAGALGTLNVRASGEVPVHHGDTVYLTPDPTKIHRFDASRPGDPPCGLRASRR